MQGFTVTRQIQYYNNGAPVVEVSVGGIDYANPDALCARYKGESKTYPDPREAARMAIAICEAWRADAKPNATVAHGATGGMAIPFEPCSYEELLQWADQAFAHLPRCAHCGNPLGQARYGSREYDEFECCSEYCAEQHYAPLLDEQAG